MGESIQEAIARMGEEKVIPEILKGLRGPRRTRAVDLLVQVAGRDLGTDEAWEAWWRERRGAAAVQPTPPAPPAAVQEKAATPPAPPPTDKKAKPGRVAMGCIGCLGLSIILVVIGYFIDPNKVEVRGDTALVEMHWLFSASSIDTRTFETAQTVYDTAKKYPDVKKIKVDLKMSGAGLVDKYGNEVEGDIEVGEIEFKDVDEIRKYKNFPAYWTNNKEEIKGRLSAQEYFSPLPASR